MKFSCKYARKVETAKVFAAGDLPGEEDEVVSIGYLSYSMKIEDGVVGGMTNIQIISDHQLQNIYPRSVSFFFSEEPISSFCPIYIGVTVLDISAFKNVSESVKYFY